MRDSFVSLIKRHTVKFSMSDLNLASPSKTSKSLGHNRFFFTKATIHKMCVVNLLFQIVTFLLQSSLVFADCQQLRFSFFKAARQLINNL